MYITISNESLALTIDIQGAETRSLKDVHTGTEYFWQGDPEFWTGTNPILFPACGGCWNGTYRHGGREYTMPKHGFVRKQPWTVTRQTDDNVTLAYTPNEKELEQFPFPCRISVTYQLVGRKMLVQFAVENLGESTMYFQMGGHPGLNLPDYDPNRPISGYIALEGQPDSVLRATTQGCTEPERFPFPQERPGYVPICVDTFANEALIFDNHQITAATIHRTDGTPLARVESSAPAWLFWAPQGQHAPFVCAEPWYGLCDRIGFEGPVEERPYINALAARETWNGGYSVEVF